MSGGRKEYGAETRNEREYSKEMREHGKDRREWGMREPGTETTDKTGNRRLRAAVFAAVTLAALILVTVAGILVQESAMETDFTRKNLAPAAGHIFGTDWMGRDMFRRTLAGMSLSIRIGILTAAVSAAVALVLGMASALLGKKADAVISWCIDLIMGIPHILLVMLISLACGKGFTGVVAGVALSHWGSLARVIRGEIMQLKQAPYILTAQKLGVSRARIARRHMFPHLLPQFITGLILLFPHAILHESGITFLGFGLSSEQPAVGVILSESMQYLTTGKWWLALFPGLALVGTVTLFAVLGEQARRLLDPASVHE